MKKLFKKSSIMLVAAGLVITGVASAAFVTHLSNSVKVKTVLESPVEMSVNAGVDGSTTGNTFTKIDTTSGSNFVFTTIAENKANDVIEGYRVFTVEAPASLPFVGGEIERVTLEHALSGPDDITPFLVVVHADGSLEWLKNWTGSAKRLVLITSSDGGSTATVNSLDAFELDWNVFTIKMHKATAPGTYRVYSQYIYDLTAYAAAQYAL